MRSKRCLFHTENRLISEIPLCIGEIRVISIDSGCLKFKLNQLSVWEFISGVVSYGDEWLC